MPKVETIDGWPVINVSASVGRGGVNLREDVLVVQALFKYTLVKGEAFRGEPLPEPTGAFDRVTERTIKKYQRLAKRNYGSLGNIVVDGRIDPAANGSSYLPGSNKRYTIILINAEADLRYRCYPDRVGRGGFVNDICARYPHVEAALKNSVGTLGLSLEGDEKRFDFMKVGLI
jgi:hypothetical protein